MCSTFLWFGSVSYYRILAEKSHPIKGATFKGLCRIYLAINPPCSTSYTFETICSSVLQYERFALMVSMGRFMVEAAAKGKRAL